MLQKCEIQVREYLRNVTQGDDSLIEKYYVVLSPILLDSALSQYLGNESYALIGRPPSDKRDYRPEEALDKAICKLHTLCMKDAVQPFDLPYFRIAKDLEEFLAVRTLQIGRLIPGKGVFLGIWAPQDRCGHSLNKVFNLFAAPYDLGIDERGYGRKLYADYNQAVRAVTGIVDLLGHKGGTYENDTILYKALEDGTYQGEWFIPTLDILYGRDKDGQFVQPDHLFRHRHEGVFQGTFTTGCWPAPDGFYWSLTEHSVRTYVNAVLFIRNGYTEGWSNTIHKLGDEGMLCRPVRAELCL